jgi:hypothetical protein
MYKKRSDVSGGACLFNQTFLLTCKQFYCEAIALFYSLATFELSGHAGWLTQRGLNPKYRSLITSASVDGEVVSREFSAILREDTSERSASSEVPSPEMCLPGVKKVYVHGRFWSTEVVRFTLRKLFKKEDLPITGDEALVYEDAWRDCRIS